MPDSSVEQLVGLLGETELRIRTGLVEIPHHRLGKESDLAVTLGVGYCDICAWKCARVPIGRTHLGIRREDIAGDLTAILSDLSVPGNCVWVSGLDVLLARLSYAEREQFWQFVRLTFRPARGLLISMPVSATNLLPDEERLIWHSFGRLAQLSSAPV